MKKNNFFIFIVICFLMNVSLIYAQEQTQTQDGQEAAVAQAPAPIEAAAETILEPSQAVIPASPALAQESSYEDKLKQWQGLSEEERQEIRKKAEAIKNLTPEQKAELKEKLNKFKGFPEEEQQRIKQNYQKFKGLAPEKREVLKERFKRFQGLPQERKDQLRKRLDETRKSRQDNPVVSNGQRPGIKKGSAEAKPKPLFKRGEQPNKASQPKKPSLLKPAQKQKPGTAVSRPGIRRSGGAKATPRPRGAKR